MRSHYFQKLQQSEIRWMLNLISDQFGWAWPSSSDYSLAPWLKTSIFDQFSKILLQHKKTIVEGVKVKYHCNSCDFKATYPWQLKQHTEAGHEVSDILVNVGTLSWNTVKKSFMLWSDILVIVVIIMQQNCQISKGTQNPSMKGYTWPSFIYSSFASCKYVPLMFLDAYITFNDTLFLCG